MLFGFAFSGFGAFRLARTLTGRAPAAWVAGIAFAFVPYRFHHIPHLSFVFAGWMPLLAEAVVLPRADVEVAVPHLGDCGAAGYEHVFAFQPGDEGEHELSVVFRGPADRVRHYPWRKFTWKKGP